MSQLGARTTPRPDELWLSRPPYLTIARILAVELRGRFDGIVSYELLDEEGYVLTQVNHAQLDDGWWRTFQPLKRRYG
jgi:hypothetical protein